MAPPGAGCSTADGAEGEKVTPPEGTSRVGSFAYQARE
jgi:hypothetical protein